MFSLGHSSVALRLYRGSAPPWIRRNPKIGLSRDVAQLQVDLTLEEPYLEGKFGQAYRDMGATARTSRDLRLSAPEDVLNNVEQLAYDGKPSELDE